MCKYSCLNILAIFSPLKFQTCLQVLILPHNTTGQGFVIERAWRLDYQQSKLLASKWNSAASTKKQHILSILLLGDERERERERRNHFLSWYKSIPNEYKNERKEIARFLFIIWQTHSVYGNWQLNVKKRSGRWQKDF